MHPEPSFDCKLHMMTITRRSAMAALVPLAAGACSPIGAFNLIAGRDAGAAQLAKDVAFGPDARHRLDIYGPEQARAGSGPLPVVVFFYGGSWDSGQRQDYAFVGMALAAQGFITVIPDYRLVPKVRFPAFLEDGALALRHVQDTIGRFGGDAGRLALAGHSAGAYNAMMLALDPRYIAAAGVARARIRCVAGLAGPYDFLPFTSPSAIAAMGQWPRPAETQPVTYASARAPATFLGTGDADTVVTPRNALTLAALLRSKGAVVEVKQYRGLDHAGVLLALSPLRRANGPVLADMTAFFRRHLGAGEP